jgi:hypothetical protein
VLEQFPALVYHLDEPKVTVVLFATGVIATIDGSTEDTVVEAIQATAERLEDLGLLVDSSPAVEVNTETIPVAEGLDSQEHPAEQSDQFNQQNPLRCTLASLSRFGPSTGNHN